MKKSLGLLELRSIAIGILAADEMLKTADVELVMSSPICPGKYVIVISGNVDSIKTAMETGIRVADIFLVDNNIINNIHEKIIPAINATSNIDEIKSIGVVETISATCCVKAGDIAAKAANVDLVEIRIARGLGGKGFVIITGELSSVKSAIKACKDGLIDTGQIISTSVVSNPHKGLIDKLV